MTNLSTKRTSYRVFPFTNVLGFLQRFEHTIPPNSPSI